MDSYNPEAYWSRVAGEIEKRGENYLAGDDNPYYSYKRRKFLRQFLDTIDFESKVVLEVGCGPGGNLRHIASNHSPRRMLGVDVSARMLDLAAKNLSHLENIELKKSDGVALPFGDRSVDICFTVTVLQHNTDEAMFRSLVQEICRVTSSTIVIMEDIGRSSALGGKGSWIGRQVGVYESIFGKHGFRLDHHQFLNTKISRAWCRLLYDIRSRFTSHLEGEPMGIAAKLLIGLPMPITRILDGIFVEELNLAKMTFRRVD